MSESDAKEIAVKFFEATNQKATRAVFAKTISQAKVLLESGYTLEEVLKAVNYATERNKDIYSLGYFSYAINKILKDIEKEEALQAIKDFHTYQQLNKNIEEVKNIDDTSERNQSKLRKLGIQSRLREKFDFDMLEEQ